jgi:5-methylcytosine-specific restriction protein A
MTGLDCYGNVLTSVPDDLAWRMHELLRDHAVGEAGAWRGAARPRPRHKDGAALRAAHLLKEPSCRGCGGTDGLEVHHLYPFHAFPEREMDPTNLQTLCRQGPGGMNCHHVLGHGGCWVDWSPSSVENAAYFLNIIQGRTRG